MFASHEFDVYRRAKHGRSLSVNEREKLLKPYLPSPISRSPTRAEGRGRRKKETPIRTFVKNQFYFLFFTFIHILFSAYIRLRQVYHALFDRVFAILYYHHRTPELIQRDVRSLSRLPEHLSVILDYDNVRNGGAGLDGLMAEVAEIASWCACAGIPFLSVYEKTGVLKDHIPTTHRAISSKFHSYFGRKRPGLQLRSPHTSAYINGDAVDGVPASLNADYGYLSMLLLSSEDGRENLVDLTKTLTEMSQRGKISPSDISPDLIDAEVSESVMSEPDLLILFGPYVQLQGFPPWQIRLTEIYHVRDNTGVGYQVFLRALHRYAKAQLRFGR
ncbi:MAG: hypothetical protein M1825_002370 [Sarcosagium campestre]|nr:MAG: hypothetical protein M1825_002370 [Sarcosagium campestre]